MSLQLPEAVFYLLIRVNVLLFGCVYVSSTFFNGGTEVTIKMNPKQNLLILEKALDTPLTMGDMIKILDDKSERGVYRYLSDLRLLGRTVCHENQEGVGVWFLKKPIKVITIVDMAETVEDGDFVSACEEIRRISGVVAVDGSRTSAYRSFIEFFVDCEDKVEAVIAEAVGVIEVRENYNLYADPTPVIRIF